MKKSEAIAFILMFAGAAGMDSPDTIVPGILALGGAAVLLLKALDRSLKDERKNMIIVHSEGSTKITLRRR